MAGKTLLESLRDELSQKSAQARELLNKKDRSGDETEKASALIEECKGVKNRITREEALETQASELKSIDEWSNEPHRTTPFATGAKGGDGGSVLDGSDLAGKAKLFFKNGRFSDISEDVGPGTFGDQAWEAITHKDYNRIFRKYLRKGEKGLSALEMKDFQLGLDDQGGVFAPAQIINTVIGKKPAITRMMNFVTNLTSARQKVSMPRLQYSADDTYTSAFRITKTGENPSSDTVASVTDSNFSGLVTIDVNTFMITLNVSRDLIEDSGFDLIGFISGKFAETYMLLREDKAINGNGVSEPDGILNKAATSYEAVRPAVVLSGSDGALTYDGLINLMTELGEQYENESTRYVFNKKSTYRALLKLKDSQNRPLFAEGVNSDGLVLRRERTLLGDPISLSQFTPNVASSAFPMIYGDLTGYYNIDRIGFSVEVLRETKALRNQVQLVGRVRFGGAVVEPWKLKIQKSHAS